MYGRRVSAEAVSRLIDRINRKPFDSEAADKGTAFNEVIDCMIENRKSETVQVEKIYYAAQNGVSSAELVKPAYFYQRQYSACNDKHLQYD